MEKEFWWSGGCDSLIGVSLRGNGMRGHGDNIYSSFRKFWCTQKKWGGN